MLNKQDIIQAIDTGVQASATQGVPDWLGATNALIDLFVANGQPFSSGEIAAHECASRGTSSPRTAVPDGRSADALRSRRC